MAINIKELFVTDLDPNSEVWWSKDKVDKINYNFDQLSDGGSPGPRGVAGVSGGFGPMGAQGATGGKGPQGYQGDQGESSLNDWNYFPEGAGLPGYLFPRKNPISINETVPVALRIGYLGPVGNQGYMVGVNPNGPIQIVKIKNNDWSNLRVEDSISSPYGYNFNFKSSGGFPRFEISPNSEDLKFRIIYIAQNIVFKTNTSTDSITINDSIVIDTGGENGPVFNLSDSLNKITYSGEKLIFTPNAGLDKVLVSTNIDGNVVWKSVKEVFSTFPIGSIISIRPEEFNADHFWLNNSINVTKGSPLNNIYGRGKIGTDYEGWYLCNGETWETVEGFNQYLTPDLNNFSYTITANGDVQNPKIVSEGDSVLIGGYDMGISAIPTSDGVYDVSYTNTFLNNNTSPGNNTIFMSTSGLYERSRMIHIVYLERIDLKWSNSGIYVPPIVTSMIELTQPAITSLLTCDMPVTFNYSWNGGNADWNTFAVPSTLYKLFNYGTTIYAKSGWYKNIDGYPMYWNSMSGNFTERGTTCVI